VRHILDLPGVEVADAILLADALRLWQDGSLDFADAYLGACARGTRSSGVLSFDRDFDRIPGVRRIDPTAVKS
jgi:predicted nucleic acid-binding protein